MTIATLNQKHFQQNDIPTRLNHLAAHLSQIQSLAQAFASEDKIVSLMRLVSLLVAYLEGTLQCKPV